MPGQRPAQIVSTFRGLARFTFGFESVTLTVASLTMTHGQYNCTEIQTMSQSKTLIFIHYIWATWDRSPISMPDWRRQALWLFPE